MLALVGARGACYRRRMRTARTGVWGALVITTLTSGGVARAEAAVTDFVASLITLGFLAQVLRIAIPYVLAALGGTISERAGVIDLALEAKLLMGAFAAAVLGYETGSIAIGIVGAAAAGALVAARAHPLPARLDQAPPARPGPLPGPRPLRRGDLRRRDPVARLIRGSCISPIVIRGRTGASQQCGHGQTHRS